MRVKDALLPILMLSLVVLVAVYPTEAQEGHAPAPGSENATPTAEGDVVASAIKKELAQPRPMDPELCLTDPLVLDELKKRRETLEKREKELEKREAEIAAKSKAIEEELSKMQAVRDEISQIDFSRAKENEERVTKLIETLQVMAPKPAAKLVATLDEALAVASLSRMDNAKLAKILALIEPEKASKLTELMAGVVRAKSRKSPSANSPERSDGSATTTKPVSLEKGGENKNDATHANQQQSTRESARPAV